MKARPRSKGWGWKTKGGSIGASRTCCSARASGWRPGRGPHQCQSGPKRSPSRPHLHGLLRGHSRSPPRIGRDRPRRCLVNPFAPPGARPLSPPQSSGVRRLGARLFRGKELTLFSVVWGDGATVTRQSQKLAEIHYWHNRTISETHVTYTVYVAAGMHAPPRDKKARARAAGSAP